MPYQKIILKPGVVTLATQLLGQGGWFSSNLIRFFQGFLSKWGGWSRLVDQAVDGVARSLHAWQDLDLIKYVAIGTNTSLELYDTSTGTIQDITPIRATVDLTTPFSTTISSTSVGVADVLHGAVAGDRIYVLIPAAIGGLIIFGYYTVTTVVDANNYTITAASAATSTVAAGGTVPVFDTTITDETVTVTLVAHGYSIGDVFTVQVSTAVGGLTLLGDYLVSTVPGANTFTFDTPSAATSTATVSENGGDVRIYYLLSAGPASTTFVEGYGTGPYGYGTYGMSSGTGSLQVPLRYWWLDNFGENLLANPTNGALYEWIPPKSETNFATAVSAAPSNNIGMFVGMPQAQVIIFGAEVVGAQDPLLVRWCDNGDYNTWIATASNQAGSYRLSRGSRCIGGLQGPQAGYIWTDIDVWQMQYVGPPFVYNFSVIAEGAGLIAPMAMAVMNRNIYWMGQQGFYTFGNTPVQGIPCPIWNTIFDELDKDNADKVIAASYSEIDEITWYYPSTDGDGEIDKYVRLNDGANWSSGTLTRTAWLDHSLLQYSLGVDADGYLQQHEFGFDADGSAMTGVSATTAYYDLEEGTELLLVDQIIPDFEWQGTSPTLTMTVYTTNWPGATPIALGPYTITDTTTAITIRGRGRQVAFRFDMSGIDMSFRLGAVRIRAAKSGRV